MTTNPAQVIRFSFLLPLQYLNGLYFIFRGGRFETWKSNSVVPSLGSLTQRQQQEQQQTLLIDFIFDMKISVPKQSV